MRLMFSLLVNEHPVKFLVLEASHCSKTGSPAQLDLLQRPFKGGVKF